ncbi:MAG: outer membrane protein assembly factor BamE [Rhodospirillaceae bacterium]|nr:outer membrane protein assembly factor BamE [Rhodospirillaceae bacterium]
MDINTAKSRMLATCAILTLGLGLFGCGPHVYTTGNRPLAEDLAKIKPGEQTRSQVREILGSPSSRSLYGQEVWFYISSTQQNEAFFATEETDRSVLSITFDDEGLVKTIVNKSKEDGNTIALSEKKTPTAGHNMTIVEQMVGNIGRFNASSEKGTSD